MFEQLALYAGKNVFVSEEEKVEEKVRRVHRLGPIATKILAFLWNNPGSTAHQVNTYIGGQALRTQHRLRDLEKRKLVVSKFAEAKPGTVANGAAMAKHFWRIE